MASAGKPLTLTLSLGGVAPSGNVYASTLVDGRPTVFEWASSAYELYEILAHDLFDAARGATVP